MGVVLGVVVVGVIVVVVVKIRQLFSCTFYTFIRDHYKEIMREAIRTIIKTTTTTHTWIHLRASDVVNERPHRGQ